MKEGWTYKTFGDIMSPARVIRCGERKLPVLSITMRNGIVEQNERFSKSIASIDKSNYKVVKNGQLVIAFPIDEGLLYTQDTVSEGIMSPAYNVWDVDFSCINRRFLVTFFHSSFAFAYYKAKLKGTTQRRRTMDKSDLLSMPIPVPPIAEQEQIVAELDLLSGIIEKKKEQLKAYDQLAQSIFYTMFGDIEEDTPVSEYISALSGGKSLAGETECKNKVLKTGAVTYDYFRGNEVKNLPADYQPIKEHLLKDGDILISRMNTLEYVGACAYVWKAPLNTYLPDRLWRATLKDNINPIFLWFSLIQDKSKEQIRSMASGTSGSMKNISIPRFLTVKIKCIPVSLQQEFAEKVEAIERQKALVQQSIEETQTMFDYTMDKYFG